MELSFKQWFLEVGPGGGGPGGGMSPPEQMPIDPDPAPGQTDAMPSRRLDKTDLPPTSAHPKMKKRMKKK